MRRRSIGGGDLTDSGVYVTLLSDRIYLDYVMNLGIINVNKHISYEELLVKPSFNSSSDTTSSSELS